MARLLETISLFLLISVIAIRPLVAESYDSSTSSIAEALGDTSDPSPVRTLAFNLLILASGCLWLASRAAQRTAGYRRTGLERAMPLWLIAAIISCLFAGNQRLAVNASFDWICLLLAPILLTQLLTRPHHRTILFAALIASAAAQTYACLDQYFLSYHDTLEHYETHKAEFWARQNVPLDSEKVILFENRIHAREALGHLPHSNVTASYLMLCLVPVAGWTFASSFRLRRGANGSEHNRSAPCDASAHAHHRPHWLVPFTGFILSAVFVPAVYLTGSRGALISAAVGVLAYAGYRFAQSRPAAARRRRVYAALLATGVLAIAALASITYVGTHFTATLLFRSQYWRAGLAMIVDHLFTGVGRENFGRHYLAYKAIESPEEVATPHNLFIQLAADFGIVGVIAAFLTILGVVRLLILRRSRHPLQHPQPASAPIANAPGTYIAWGTALAASLVVARFLLTDSSNPSFVYYTTTTTVLAWILGFTAAITCVHLSPSSMIPPMDRFIVLSIVIFLIHEQINFALFVPGSAITFFAFLAIPLSVAGASSSARTPDVKHTIAPGLTWRSAAILASVAMIVVAGFIALPVVRACRHLRQADLVATQPQPFGVRAGLITHHLTVAGIVDPLDPTPHERLAEWKFAESTMSDMPMESLAAAELAAREAIGRDPHHLRPRRLLVRILRRQAELSGNVDDFQRAIATAADAVALYPADPNGYITLADVQAAASGVTRSASLAREAIAGYERALALDEQRWSGETIRRFNERQKTELRMKITALMTAIQEPASPDDD